MTDMYDGKVIDKRYEESSREFRPNEISGSDMHNVDVLEVDYVTNRGTEKTVRGEYPRTSDVLTPPDYEGLVFGSGSDYGLNLDEPTLFNMRGSKKEPTVLAEGEDVLMFRLIEYPKPVPVEGCPQEDVFATVYYISKRSGNIKKIGVKVESIEGDVSEAYGRSNKNPKLQILGDHKYRGMVTVNSAWDRSIQKGLQSGKSLGKVVRIDFPRGHQFNVDLRNLPDEKVEVAMKKLENYAQEITSRYSKNIDEDISVKVNHEGRIPEDEY